LWGAIIGAAIGLGSSIYGQHKAGKESENMNAMLNKKERDLDSYYKGETIQEQLRYGVRQGRHEEDTGAVGRAQETKR
jgi:hypothetical protein